MDFKKIFDIVYIAICHTYYMNIILFWFYWVVNILLTEKICVCEDVVSF